MDVLLSDEQRELVRTAQKLLADVADPLPPAWDSVGAGLNRRLWRALGDLGVLGLGVPESRGGAGGGLRELCLVAEQVGAVVARIPFVGHSTVLALAPEHAGVVTDGSVVAVPAWETFPMVPGHDREALHLSDSTVHGVLRAVPFGMDADLLVAFAGDSAVLINLDQPGVRREPVSSFDVTEPAAAVQLSGVATTILNPPEFEPRVLAVVAAELIGTGQRALDDAVAYATQRHQFGRAIGSFQAIKHMLADRHVQLDAARLLVGWAATAIGEQQRPDAEAAARTALIAASDAAQAAAGDALQAHGGIGFTWEHPSHVRLKRARARRSLFGPPARQLDALASNLFAAEARTH